MSDLAATNCGCGCSCNEGFGNNCLWIILLLLFCGNNCGGCQKSCGCGNDWIILILILFCCKGNNGCGCNGGF